MRNSFIEGETEALDASLTPDLQVTSERLVSRVSQMRLPSETNREQELNVDERLVTYLRSTDADSQAQLEYLIEKITKPTVSRILQRAVRTGTYSDHEADSQDLQSEAVLRILTRLRASRSDPERHPISNIDGLVATITYRVIADHLRTKNRQRTNLEKKIRRLFAVNKDLSIWEDNEGNPICGYVEWHRKNSRTQSFDISEVALDLNEVGRGNKKNTGELILLTLRRLQRPIKLKHLVEVINDISSAPRDPHNAEYLANTSHSDLAIATGLTEKRRLLHRLFAEMQKLDINQRRALLLNMVDSYGYSIEWFLFAGIATDTQLADLLDISVDEFRTLLNELPMTDKEIAKKFHMTASKVANIRKAVRERLGRCREAFLRGE